jgi:hypothetical protein
MPELRDVTVPDEGTIVEPQPDPWAPPGAKYAQALSIGTGVAGVGTMAGDPSTTFGDQAIAMLPDPSHIFASLANVLGFQVEASGMWKLGFLLVVLSLALNIYSFALRYFHARAVMTAWEERERQRRAKDAQLQASTGAARKQGFISGEG